MKNINKYLIFCLLLIICLGCGKTDDNKIKIKKILFKGKFYDKKKQYHDALSEFKLLKKYQDSPVYEEIDPAKSLEKLGWSIDNLESSLTIKVMTDFQNEINNYVLSNGEFPNFTMHPFVVHDAWGNFIEFNKDVEEKHKKFFDYFLYSKGADLGTEGDDIAIYNKSINKITKTNKKNVTRSKSNEEKFVNLEDMIKNKKNTLKKKE